MTADRGRHAMMWVDRAPQTTAAAAAVVGLLALAGWLSGMDVLKSVIPGLTFMKVNTAVGFILSAVALWGSQAGGMLQAIARACAGLVLLLATLTLGEYLSGADLGIDQLLIRETTHLPGDIPGRMAVNTAISFAAVGAALLMLNLGKSGFVAVIQTLALAPLLLGGSAVIAYSYNIEEFLREKLNYTPMSLPAATAFVLLAMGIVTARPDYPLRRFITSSSAAGIIVRRLLPAAVAFTLAAGWLMMQGYRGGYLSETLVLALFTAVSIAGLGALILWNAGILYEEAMQRARAEQERSAAAQYARSLIEASLDPLVTISAEGKITDVNEATVQATGVPRELLVGSDFSEYFTEPDKARAGYQEVFAKGLVTDYPLTLRHVSGKVTDVLYNATVYRNDKGEVAGVFAAARDVTERKQAEEQLKERIKELRAFYSLSELAERRGITLDMLYQELATILPQSWQYTEITCARIMVGECEFHTTNFRETEWMQAAPITVHGAAMGRIEVGYLEPRPQQDEGPFLKEERQLINAVAERIGHITERKRAEEELRAASLYARSLIEASLDPLVTISPAGKVTDVNEATVQATGVPRELLVGSDFSEYFTEPDRARAGYQEVFAKGYVRDYPLSLRHVSGGVREVLYNASVYRGVKGEVAGVFAAARDITERKRAEEELRGSEERFRALADATSEGVVLHEKGRIVEVNHHMEDILGRPRAQIVGATVLDFVAPAWRDMVSGRVQQPADVRVEFAFMRPDGSEVTVSGLAHDCMYLGRPMRVAAYRDITEQKRAEEELRKYHEKLEELVRERTSQLETVNKDLEGFAYSVSHDLRVPLRAIDGFSHMLLKHYPDKLDDEGKRYLNVVRDNTRKMAQLIDDILAFSRMGRLGMTMSEVDMEGLAHAVFEDLRPNLGGRELTMEIKPLPLCQGDQAMLKQVWVNLLANAVKFTRDKAAALVEVGGRSEGGENIYYVKDNGAGFDMQFAGKLFGVFQRLHGVDEFEGTGIGLAIVKRIVTRHGGRVWAEGKVNEGATFYFALPSHQPNT